jgi:hypothetical protein
VVPTWRQLTHDCRQTGWTAISTDGPQLLPASSGGVTAYKFRDPEGHPLELIAFPTDAIPAMAKGFGNRMPRHRSFRDFNCRHGTKRQILRAARIAAHSGGSLNHGPEQDKLDGFAGALVEVTALAPP